MAKAGRCAETFHIEGYGSSVMIAIHGLYIQNMITLIDKISVLAPNCMRQRRRGLLPMVARTLSLIVLTLALATSPAGAAEELEANTSWRDASRCGINSAYVLLKLNGFKSSYSGLLEQFSPKSLDGTSLRGLRDILNMNGLQCQVCKTDVDGLRAMKLPVIVHMELDNSGSFSLIARGHYSVVVAIKANAVWLIDGTSGSLTEISSDEFHRRWTGYLVCKERESVPIWLKIVTFGNFAILIGSITQNWRTGRKDK